MKRIYLKLVIAFSCLFLVTKLAYSQNGKPSNVKLPATYTFNWKMAMEVQAEDNVMKMEYFLKTNEDYLAFSSEEVAAQTGGAKVFVVMDAARKVNCTFMDVMGQKMLQKSAFDTSSVADVDDYATPEMKKIGSKSILGYNCEGFETETTEYKMTFYITNEVPVSMSNVFNNMSTLSRSSNFEMLKKYAENGAVLEMHIEDKQNNNESAKMICTAIEKTDVTIKTSEYKSMF